MSVRVDISAWLTDTFGKALTGVKRILATTIIKLDSNYRSSMRKDNSGTTTKKSYSLF